MTEKRIRLPLIALDAFVGVTTIFGALFVVPTLPLSWLRFFPDYTIPAIALGVVGLVALTAAVAVAVRPAVGAEVSFASGLMMAVFEVVEALAVGNLIAPPPVSNAQGSVALWLQVVYFVIGFTMAILGLRLWSRSTPGYSWSDRVRRALGARA